MKAGIITVLIASFLILITPFAQAHEEHQEYFHYQGELEHHHHHHGWQGWPRLFEPQRYWYCDPWGHCWWRWRE